MTTLDDLLGRLSAMPAKDRKEFESIALKATESMAWVPNVGPQTDAYFSEADEIFYGGQAGGGKRLCVDTLLPTPDGWTTMGAVNPGDVVFSLTGEPTTVTAVSPVEMAPRSFEVEFDTGEVIYADGDHRWFTITARERDQQLRLSDEWRARRRAERPSRAVRNSQKPWVSKSITRVNRERAHEYLAPANGGVRTTDEIASSLIWNGKVNHAVPVAASLHTKEAVLPIDPYLFGLWLGDGNSRCGSIGMDFEDMDEVLTYVSNPLVSRKVETKGRKRQFDTVRFECMQTRLRALGVLGDKRIPMEYLRASRDDRVALLQGLMDTDGTADKRGQCEIALSKPDLMDDVLHLVSGLGIKATIRTRQVKRGNPSHRIKFVASFPVFRLRRKAERQAFGPFRKTVGRRYIVAVRPCLPRVMRCIAVDHPSRLYLVGKTCIPTHNTDLALGLAVTAHRRSLILRRINKDAVKLVERASDIVGHRDGYNGQLQRWKMPDGKLVEFGGCEQEADKQRYKGDPHDLICFDEVSDFLESQYRFIIGWNRSTTPGQRCRVIAAGNPPTTPEGLWVLKYWGAWLDKTHPNPAKPGELRWYTTIGGVDTEVDGPGPHEVNGRMVKARSRTFIPSTLEDNPDLAATDYASVLEAMPDELRRAYREGDFTVGLSDADFQVIPTAWIEAAQARWTDTPPQGIAMTAIGCDVAPGGLDNNVIASRYGGWYARLVAWKEPDPDGNAVAGKVVQHRRDNCPVVVDLGGGWGGDAAMRLKDNGVTVVAFNGVEASSAKSRDGRLSFFNKRAEATWRFREALDPEQEGGSAIALPPDAELKADLASYRWVLKKTGIQIESKEDIRKRIGRSPDKGDAVVMALSQGDAAQLRMRANMGRKPQVKLGHEKAKRRRH